MNKFFIISMVLLMNVQFLSAQKIDQITEIAYHKTMLETSTYHGAIRKYENRLLVDTYYSKEEYLILENGELERILFL